MLLQPKFLDESKPANPPAERLIGQTLTLPPRLRKTRLGCQKCKDRHIRCDQAKPECTNCIKKGIRCPGSNLAPELKWVQQARQPLTVSKSLRKPDDALEFVFREDFSPIRSEEEESCEIKNSSIPESISRELTSISKPSVSSFRASPNSISSISGKESTLSIMISRSLSELDHKRQFLISHYFDQVAPIFTIFDGPENPFGEPLRRHRSFSSLIIDTITSIAAIHLSDSQNDGLMWHRAFTLRSQAVNALNKALDRMTNGLDTLIAALMLSMTESYFRPESCGIVLLDAARQTMSSNRFCLKDIPKSHRNVFYWLEMLTSLVADYDGLTTSVLGVQPFEIMETEQTNNDVDALVGTWADLLPRLGRLANAVRFYRRDGPTRRSTAALLSIETYLLGWKADQSADLDVWGILEDLTDRSESDESLTPATIMSDLQMTDDSTISNHCAAVADAYRLSGLLHLYYSCPFVLNRRISVLPETEAPEIFLNKMSDAILTLLKPIPIDSRLFNVCSFPLMTAGQFSTSMEDRQWILSVIDNLRIRNGIAAVSKLGHTLQEVWLRRDSGEVVTWTDIFEEQKCTMLIN